MDIPIDVTADIERELLQLQPWMHAYRFAPDTIVGSFKHHGIAESACGPTSDPELIQRMQSAYDELTSTRDGWQIQTLADRLGSLAGLSALDIASATGRMSFLLAERGATDVRGVEIRAEQVEQAQLVKRLAGSRFAGVSFEHDPSSADSPTYRDGETYDLVLSMGLLYHLTDPIQHLRNLRRLTRKAALLHTLTHSGQSTLWQLVLEDPRFLTKAVGGVAWVPPHRDLPGLLQSVGFARVEPISYPELSRWQRRLDGLPRMARLLMPGAATALQAKLVQRQLRDRAVRLMSPGYHAYIAYVD